MREYESKSLMQNYPFIATARLYVEVTIKTLEPRDEHRKAVCRATNKVLTFISLTGKRNQE